MIEEAFHQAEKRHGAKGGAAWTAYCYVCESTLLCVLARSASLR